MKIIVTAPPSARTVQKTEALLTAAILAAAAHVFVRAGAPRSPDVERFVAHQMRVLKLVALGQDGPESTVRMVADAMALAGAKVKIIA
ncbi:MAG: hypothetical protein IPJ61_20260 [Tessaracoccus sp.]|uniref:hypothetical protein n=1 Tax=Tessaracoccus sp. TaxID=1971211 RepID=UPI001EB4FD20|nr:hypothetical protein [Tessaracoccus sp.]MBK7823322.1 hypothetical protein [Tessaracoccus sp.]